jgi:hypothetical protein
VGTVSVGLVTAPVPEPQGEDTVPLRLCMAEVKGEELAAVLDGVRVHPSS